MELGHSPALELGHSPALELGYSPALELGYSPALELGYIPALELGSGPALVLGCKRYLEYSLVLELGCKRTLPPGNNFKPEVWHNNNKALIMAVNLKGLLGYPTYKLFGFTSRSSRSKMRRFVEPVFKTDNRR